MKVRHSLKKHIARTFVLLALLLASFFTLATYIAVEVIEAQVIDSRMQKIAQTLVQYRGTQQAVVLPPDMQAFSSTSIPKELQQLAPGVYELELDGREVQALVYVKNGERFAIVHDMVEFEKTEFVIFTALGAGFVCSLILAILLGLGTAKHVIEPVSLLAEAVEKNTKPEALPSLDTQNEIGILARAFAKRTDELNQFLLREQLFTGDVSHELRTPITVMLGAAEVLTAQLAAQPAQLAVAERIRRVCAETSERVSALLLLSRSPELLDAPRIHLNSLIQSEIDRYQFLLANKPVKCIKEWPDQIWVEARPELVSIAIGNLLRNAFQHTDAGTVLVKLTANQLVIEDSGPGIPVAIRERLFERFVHADSRSAEGTGLGLSIVKRVAGHIGWDVNYESPGTTGSRFILTFTSVEGDPLI